MTLLRTAALILAVGTVSAAPALAQTLPSPQQRGLAPSSGAAATLPNTFDRPTGAPPTTTSPPAGPGQVTEIQMAEAALQSIITQLQAGDIDERLFTPTLATRLNDEMATYKTRVQAFGALQSIEAQGAQGGAGQFLVIFDNAATQWRIGLEDGGLVAALLFREAPVEASDAPAAGS